MTIPYLLYKYVWESASEWKWLSKFDPCRAQCSFDKFYVQSSWHQNEIQEVAGSNLQSGNFDRDLCFSYQWIKLGLGSCQLLDSSGRKDL